jgi:prepilin-type N-terminal cleavage/methylation domain-containing protein
MLPARCQNLGRKPGITLFGVARLSPPGRGFFRASLPGSPNSTCSHRTHGEDRNKIRGFSIVELLIVVSVITIIAAIAIPHLVSALDSARDTKAVGDIKAIETDILGYESTNGALPDSLAQGTRTFSIPGKIRINT